jgi:hypothetical protein
MSPALDVDERSELIKLATSIPSRRRLMAEVLGFDELADVYFADRPHRPNPGPQTRLMFEDADEIGYGGARGGGKSYGFLMHFAEQALTWGYFARGILFRRRFVDLEDLIEDSHRVYAPLGGVFYAGGGRPYWRLPGGGILRLRYLEKEQHAALYQGHAYTWIGVEEAGTYSSFRPIELLRGCLRSVFGVPCQMLLNFNPGGVGHGWLKSRYIDPAPPGEQIVEHMKVGGEMREWRRVFIPARLEDNPALEEADPEYRTRLEMVRPEWLRKAWLNGDFNIVPSGGMFDDVLNDAGLLKVVIDPFPIPDNWPVYRALDWGSAKPFSVGWWTVANGEDVELGDGRTLSFARNSLIRIAEWYGTGGDTDSPNEGCRMTAANVAKGILEREKRLKVKAKIKPGPADTQIYAQEGHERTLADEMKDPDGTGANKGVRWKKANKGPGSRVNGWDAMRRVFEAAIEGREKPGMFIFNTCRDWIRTVPMLPRDTIDPEDVDTNSEDHIADETRYMLTTKRGKVSEEPWEV